jgi:very-short-patch-repair endonuclease
VAKRIGSPYPENARTHRRNPTEPEKRLWQVLRNRHLGGLKFRRQTSVGPYIADFLCLDAMLIVEVDGDTHAATQSEDQRRTVWLEAEGFQVIRFGNADVMTNIEGLATRILSSAQRPSPSQACRLGPLPLPEGEG